MTLRELLNNISYGEMTEEELLDLEVKVQTESSSGTLTTTCGIKKVTVEQELVYSVKQHKQVPKEKNGKPYVTLFTTMTR